MIERTEYCLLEADPCYGCESGERKACRYANQCTCCEYYLSEQNND